MVPGQGGETGVRDHDALGHSGRARGVDDVGRRGGPQWRRPVGVGRVRDGLIREAPAFEVAIEQQRRAGHRHIGGGHDERGVSQQVPDPLARVLDVHRQVGRARLEDRDDRQDQLARFRQRERDDVTWADAQGDQVVREPVGPLVELRVGPPPAVELDGGIAGHQVRLPLEQLREGRLVARLRELGGQRQALLDSQDIHSGHSSVRIGRDLHEQRGEAVGDRLRGDLFEQIGSIRDDTVDPGGLAVGVAVLPQAQREVHLSGTGARTLDLNAQPRPLRFGDDIVALQRERDLEQRVMR